MIIALGIDIISIDRIININCKKRFLKRLLHHEEYNKTKNIDKFLSKNFSIKESIVKALGTGFINGIAFKKICIKRTHFKKPFLKTSCNTDKALISLSYEKKFTIAITFIMILSKLD